MESQALVLDRVFLLLVRFARWPSWDELDRELYATRRVPRPWETVSQVERNFLWGIGPDQVQEPEDGRTVGLSLVGLSQVGAAFEDLRVFLESVRLAARVALENPYEDVMLGPGVLRARLQLTVGGRDDLLRRQRALWETVSLWSTLGGTPGDPAWTVLVRAKALRQFETIAEADALVALTPGEVDNRATAHAVDADSTAGGTDADAVEFESLPCESGAVYGWAPGVELGHGSNGHVFAGVGSAGEMVAVKRCELRGFDPDKWYRDGRYAEREQVVAEYLRGKGLVHVLPLFDHAWTNDALFLVYPRAEFSAGSVVRLVAGESRVDDAQDIAAATIFGAGGLSADELLAVVVDLVRGLVELHKNGVVHRDVKPDNALLHEGRWQWADLGSSRLVDALTSTYTLRDQGTYGFLAPEVGPGVSATERSDVYSLGCTIYALVTGAPPFGVGAEAVPRHLSEQPDLLKVSDLRMREVLRWMLSKDPGARPTISWVLEQLTGEAADDGSDDLAVDWSDLSASTQQRESEAAQARARVTARRVAGENSEAQLFQIWRQLISRVARRNPLVEEFREDAVVYLVFGGRRLSVRFQEPADGTSVGLRLGTVVVEAEQPGPRAEVANIVALAGLEGEPEWRLFRMNRNDLAPPNRKMRVSESFADEHGAVSLQDLERHLVESEEGSPGARSASRYSDEPLTAVALEKLLVAELRAINEHLKSQ